MEGLHGGSTKDCPGPLSAACSSFPDRLSPSRPQVLEAGTLPPLRAPVRMPQSQHVVPIKESADAGGKAGVDRSEDEVAEMCRLLINAASSPVARVSEG